MKKLEYKVVKFPMPGEFSLNMPIQQEWDALQEAHQSLLNELGKDRWEYYDRIGVLFYFKREVDE